MIVNPSVHDEAVVVVSSDEDDMFSSSNRSLPIVTNLVTSNLRRDLYRGVGR